MHKLDTSIIEDPRYLGCHPLLYHLTFNFTIVKINTDQYMEDGLVGKGIIKEAHL